ncbi:MAG: glycosyltransferase family 4 protein [Cyanobacteria bacterium J06635_13]
MKIAVIGVKGLPAQQGGIERYCEELYPRLVAQGHQVDLYARPSYLKRSWFSIYTYRGVRVICLPSFNFRGLDALFSSAIASLATVWQNYDVVHFHALGPALFSWLPRLASSAKVVVTCQGLDWQRAKWGKLSSKIIYWGEKTAVKHVHALIVVSQNLQSYFADTYGLQTAYIPNGPGEFADSDSSFKYVRSLGLAPDRYLLFLGRLVPEKRPDLLIQAFQKLQAQGWKLAFTGGISDTEKYSDYLRELAADNPNIVFTGELQGKWLAEMVRGAGLFVLPSDLEGLPLVMLEAMKEAVPVLASDIPPHVQLIAPDKGYLFAAGNCDSCVEALEIALQQPEVRAAMAKKAQRQVLAKYNWEKITEENLDIYQRLVFGTPAATDVALEAEAVKVEEKQSLGNLR